LGIFVGPQQSVGQKTPPPLPKGAYLVFIYYGVFIMSAVLSLAGNSTQFPAARVRNVSKHDMILLGEIVRLK